MIVPPGNGTFLIRTFPGRSGFMFEMLQFWSNVYTAEGKGERRYWGGKGSGLG